MVIRLSHLHPSPLERTPIEKGTCTHTIIIIRNVIFNLGTRINIMIIWKDKFGKEIDAVKADELLRNREYKRVGYKRLWNGLLVSSVWLGLDHGFGKKEKWFETMVFTPYDLDYWWRQIKPNPIFRNKWTFPPRFSLGEELFCFRYETLHQAEQGHEAIVRYYSLYPFIRKEFK